MKHEIKHRPENDRQKAALEYYQGLGYRRTYAAVAEKFNVSIRTVKYWSGIYSWRERINKRDLEQIQIMKMSLDPGAIEVYERLLEVVRAAKARTIRLLAEGKQRPTMGDLVSLVRARLEAEELVNEMEARQASADASCVVIYDPRK
jgi:uncharacterized protein YjcR